MRFFKELKEIFNKDTFKNVGLLLKLKLYFSHYIYEYDPVYDEVLQNIIDHREDITDIWYDKYNFVFKFKNNLKISVWGTNLWYAFLSDIRIERINRSSSDLTLIKYYRSSRPSKIYIIKFLNFLLDFYHLNDERFIKTEKVTDPISKFFTTVKLEKQEEIKHETSGQMLSM